MNKILKAIKTPNDKLKDIKSRLNNNSISYNGINIVLANIKGKHKKKNITYFIEWYKKQTAEENATTIKTKETNAE